jgi:hypothetical protein
MVTTRQGTSDNTRNEAGEGPSGLHPSSSSISQGTEQVPEMQQDNPGSGEVPDRQDTGDDAVMDDVDSGEIEMERELAALREERRLAHLRQELEQARADKALGFPVVTLPVRSRQGDELQKEKMFKIVDPKRYKGAKQHDLNTFVRECQGAFDIRPLTYALDKDKILYAQGFLDGTPAEDWARRRVSAKLETLSWQDFVDFLQENLNPKHLRMLDLSNRLKKARQLPGQTVAELITYVNDLEVQLPEPPTDYQRYCNLMEALHPHLRTGIIRRTNTVISRTELEELARLVEKTEPVPENLKAKIRSSGAGSKPGRYRPYSKPEDSVPSSDSAPQGAVQSLNRAGGRGRGGWRGRGGRGRSGSRPGPVRTHYRGDRSFGNGNSSYDKSNVECYNCGQKGHYKNECTQPKKSESYGEGSGSGKGQAP